MPLYAVPTTLSQPPVSRREIYALVLLLAAAFASRLPFLMHGLDEWNTANFALSVVHFDVMTHQPHPPGQYVYVRLMQFLNLFCHNELLTLTLGSILGGTLALVPYYFALRQVFRPAVAMGAAILTAFSFGPWIGSLRMVSDPVASLFVYGTVCALLLGLTSGRWFVFGMALCGLTLGVKQTAVYFLVVFTVLVNGWVLLCYGLRRPLVGSAVFALVVAAWLLPTVSNTHGWANYLAGCRAMQLENYTGESLLFRLTAENASIQARHDLLDAWGSTALAGAMLALSAAGLVLCLQRGVRGVLFGLFGLSVILYAYFFLYRFNKYYLYYVPFYCALASAALFSVGEFLAGRLRWSRARWLVPGAGITVLTLAGVYLTAPLLPKIAHFRAPPQAAVEALRRLPDAGPVPLLLTDDSATDHELLYFHVKKQIDLLNRHADLSDAAAALNAGRKVYFVSPVALDADSDQPDTIHLIGSYEWRPELYDPLQGRHDLRHLVLYELLAPLPADYRFRAEKHPPLLFSGMYEDGWCGPTTRMVLPGSAEEGSQLHLRLVAPEGFNYHYPYDLACRFDGGSDVHLTMEHAGAADFTVPLPGRPGERAVEVQLTATQALRPAEHDKNSSDQRYLAVLLEEVNVVPAPPPLRVQPEEGWYAQESDGRTEWRWTDGNAGLLVQLSHAATLTVDGDLLASAGDNVMELLVDGRPAGTFPVSATEWRPLAVRLPLAAGAHQLVFHGRNPGAKVAGDPRVLALCLRGLEVRLE